MRKPRYFDAELKALEDKARGLKTRKVQQLGELVIATGADTLTANELAGALIVLAETKEAGKREAWAKRGATFFQGRARRSAPATDRDTDNTLYQQAEGPGLVAIAEGFRHLGYKDDHELNAAEWIVYDALYAYAQEMVRRGKPAGQFAS